MRVLSSVLLACVLALSAACAQPPGGPENLLRNAGFTRCTVPGQPDYWGTGAPEWASNFPGNYHTHPASPVPGTQSLMLRNEEGQPNWTVQSHLYRGISPEADYSLSVWLKAGRAGTKAVLWMGPARRDVEVSDRWERYTWTTKPGANSWGYTIRFTIPQGTLWIAAPMWVAGPQSAEFALHPADQPAKPTKAAPGAQRPLPVATVALVDHQPSQGFDSLPWDQATVLPPFVDLNSAAPVQPQTQVRLLTTKQALFVSFNCLQPDMANVQVVGDKHDSGVYGGECLEFFIAPEQTAGPYYHFAVNPDGVRAEEQGFDSSWGCWWEAKCERRPDGWTALIRLPWAEFPLSARATNVFGMNFCRHAKAGSEQYSEWSCTDGGFHNPSRFGLVTLPGEVIAPRALDLAWTGTWTRGNSWGLTLTARPGAANGGERSVLVVVHPPGPDSPAGVDEGFRRAVRFTPGKPLTLRLGPLPGKPLPGEYTAAVSVSDVRGGGPGTVLSSRLLTRTVVAPASSVAATGAPLSVLLDRSYYTTEQRARLRVWCSVPRAASLRVTWPGHASSVGLSKPCNELTVPLEELALGASTVEVRVRDRAGDDLGLAATTQLVKLAPQPYGVKVDRFAGCFLVDGKPFVPYCMGIHSLGQLDRLQDIKDHGFNTICAGFSGSPTEADLQANLPRFNAFFDACRKLGLKIIWWNGGGEDYERIRDGFLRNIAAFKANDLILAWYILDEPEGWWESPTRKESDLPKFKEAVTAADPYRPSFFNYYSWKTGYGGYGGLVSSDVGSLDRYPIGRSPDAMGAMDDITRQMAADCLPVGKPVNIWLQLYGYDDAVREATAAEQRCQTYLCLIAGSRSIMYFIYKPMGLAMWESMLPLGREIAALTPVFGAAPPQRPLTCDAAQVRFMHRYVGGKWTIVCANKSAATVTATFDLSGLGVHGEAVDKFGGRKLPLRDGKLQDTFAPLATRVYEVY